MSHTQLTKAAQYLTLTKLVDTQVRLMTELLGNFGLEEDIVDLDKMRTLLWDKMVKVTAETYTPEELDGVLEFLNSEIGVSIAEKSAHVEAQTKLGLETLLMSCIRLD